MNRRGKKSCAFAREALIDILLDCLLHTTNGDCISAVRSTITLAKPVQFRILTLANIDPRILYHLRDIRSGATSYRTNTCARPEVITSLTRDLGYPASYGDQSRLPAYGGAQATAVWKTLGVPGRDGVGGLPCEIVHQGLGGGSCTAHAGLRWITSFGQAMALYLPVCSLKILPAWTDTITMS